MQALTTVAPATTGAVAGTTATGTAATGADVANGHWPFAQGLLPLTANRRKSRAEPCEEKSAAKANSAKKTRKRFNLESPCGKFEVAQHLVDDLGVLVV